MTAVLLLRGVELTYRSGSSTVTALHDIDLSVDAGETVCVAGRSGSGKSSLCHLAAGLELPTRGSVTVAGRPSHEVRDWALAACVPQQLGLIPELTVAETVSLPLARAGRPSTHTAELLQRLGIEAISMRLIGDTSLGEQQRVALARALVLTPSLLVLDEPTGHQDDEHVGHVLDALSRAGDDGSAVLVASHDDRVLAVADRVVGLADGSVMD
jgi:ABC-type lipoprotein export system ATPase subunit